MITPIKQTLNPMIYFTRIDHPLFTTTMTKTLEIDIRSADGLKLNRKPVKRKTFAVVKIGEKSRSTNLDESSSGGGGSNPTWNYKTEMEIPINGSVEFIFIEVFYKTGSGRHVKKIGEAKIPTTDFIGRFSSPQGHLNFLSYRLRDEYGDKCGIVNLSIMVKDTETTTTSMLKSSSSSEQQPSISGYNGRIVTGVPVSVWCMIQRSS